MSNLIKSNYIYFDQGDKRVINSDVRYSNFVPFVPVREEAQSNPSVNNEPTEFVEGMNVVNMDKLLQKEKETINRKAESIIEEAKLKAEQIISEAQIKAGMIKEEAYNEGKAQGYADGIQEGEAYCNVVKKEYQDKIYELEREYETHISRLEPDFVDVMIALIQKITGVIIEDKKEIILHLVNKAIKQEEKSNCFTIKVSKEDYTFLDSHRNKLLSVIGDNATIEIMEDKTLNKNQCFIETDSKIIDCSLDVQLTRLVDDLKLLSQV